MSIESALFGTGLCCLLLIAFMARYFKWEHRFMLVFMLLTLMIFGIIHQYGLDFYKLHMHQKAFEATSQQQRCGAYQGQIILKRFKNVHEIAYQFKTSDHQFIEFNGDALTQRYYPLLTQVKKGDRLCFGYAAHVQDWNGRYYLTQLSQLNP